MKERRRRSSPVVGLHQLQLVQAHRRAADEKRDHGGQYEHDGQVRVQQMPMPGVSYPNDHRLPGRVPTGPIGRELKQAQLAPVHAAFVQPFLQTRQMHVSYRS